MNLEYFIMPNDQIAASKDLAAQRGISLEELIVEQIDRFERDADFKTRALFNGQRVLVALRNRVDTEWPLNLNESIACAAVVAQTLEDSGLEELLRMPEERLASLDWQSRISGKSYEQLLVSEILSRPENQAKKA